MRTRTLTRRWDCFLAGLVIAVVLPAAVAAQERSPSESALVIEEILPDSAAAKAGFAVGDRVLTYDAKPLQSPAALQAAEENTFTTTVALRVRRGDEALTMTAPSGRLGIQVRPALSPDALTLYEEGKRAQQAKNTDDVVARWTAAANAVETTHAAAAAWLHGRVGETHDAGRQWKAACVAYERAWRLAEQASDTAGQSRQLRALGRCSANLNDLPAAERWHTQAHQVNEGTGKPLWAAGSLDDLGGVARERGDLAAAEIYHRRGLAIFERLAPDSRLVASGYNNLAMVLGTRGDLPAAEDSYRRALAILERLMPNSASVSAVLNNLGTNANDRGDLAAAHDYLTRSLAITEQLGSDSLDVANGLTNLGNVAIDRGELEAAKENNSRALEIRNRLIPDSLPVAISLNNLGIIARSRGDLAEAEEFHIRALRVREQVAPDSLVVAASLNNLGNVVRDRGDLLAAEAYHTRGLAIKDRVAPNSLSMASSLQALGNIVRDRGDLSAAENYFRRSLGIRERLAPNGLDVATSLNNLGLVASSRGDLPAAQDYFDRALAIRERLAPDSLSVAESLHNHGHIARERGDSPAAERYYTRALAIRERLAPNSLHAAGSLNSLAGIAMKARRYSDALPLFTRAVDIIEAQRSRIQSAEARALLLAQHTESYAGLLRTHVALDDLPAAFATAERFHARSLLEILTEARAEIRQGVDPELLKRERLLQQLLNVKAERQTQMLGRPHTDNAAAEARKELDALLVQFQEVQGQIRVQGPRYASLTQPRPLTLVEVQQQALDVNTVLLEYTLGEDSSHLFVVTPTSIRAFELPKRAVIEDAARRVYQLLIARQSVRGETARQRQDRIDRADAEFAAAAAVLSDMTLGAVAGQLANKRLLIVADGALQYVPFAALPEPTLGHQAPPTGQTAEALRQPLMVNHEIVSLPSASIVTVLRQQFANRQPAERLVAVLADPVFDPADPRLARARRRVESGAAAIPRDVATAARSAGLTNDRGSLSRLPFSREEADAILALAAPGQGTRAVDFNASRATATGADLSRYRVVHLATHGLLDTEHPELSGVVLSLVDEHGTAQDGFLRLHEVYNLNWSAELVVLSACQTALGKEIKGEGLVGLTRGFMYAGAERVLASLWSVNDGATAQFMKRFYRGLFAEDLSPAAALRAAQVEMSKQKPWRAPYYWAGFVLQGDWK